MPRIPYLRDEEAGPDDIVESIRQRRGGRLLNLDRHLLYCPPVAAGWNQLLGAVRTRLALPPRLRELAMCAVATLNDAPYEFHHHAPEFLKAGGTTAQVDALRDVATALGHPELFDRAEFAVLRLAAEMTRGVTVKDETFAELHGALRDDRLVVEAVITVAAYNMVSRVIVALQIEPEAAVHAAVDATDPSKDRPARVQSSGRVNVPGAAIAYRIEGPEGAPVLMLGNSLATEMSMWEPVLARLTSRFRVLRYDMRGHGASSTPSGNYSMAALADDAIALLDALKLQRVHFIGISLGGMVGQQLAARFPNRIAGLVLCATMSAQLAPDVWAERIALVKAQGLEAIVDATLQRWFTPGFLEREPALADQVRSMILGTRAAGWLGCAAPIRDLAQTSLLERMHSPTLLLAGAQDAAAPPEMMQLLARQIAGATLHVIEGAAHLIPMEQPDAFSGAVLDFLAGVEAADARLST